SAVGYHDHPAGRSFPTRRSSDLVAPAGGPGLAQRAVHLRLRRAPGRGRSGGWRHGAARRALAGLARPAGRLPDGGPIARRADPPGRTGRGDRPARSAGGPVRGPRVVSAPGSIAAVVVTYQSGSTIDECLLRLRDAEGVTAIRVVDNASTDETLAIVQRHATADPRVRFIANPDNPGFGTACNQGVAAVHPDLARWVALVNPDLMVEPDSLARMVALARQNPWTLLGADLVGEDGI